MMPPPEIPNRPFTAQQAAEIGIPRQRLSSLVEARRLRVVLRNVYAPYDLPDTIEVRLQAAALVVSPFMVVCDRTAAWVHGVDVLEYFELDVWPPLDTWVLRGHNRVVRAGCTGGERDLSGRDIQLIDGIWVTTPLRTALDLGCRLSRRRALAALDALMRLCGITREEVLAELPRFFRRRGVVQLRQLAAIADPRAESSGESWTRLEIIDAGLPAPEPQYSIRVGGIELYRLDLAYPHAKVCIEYDGREFHEGDLAKKHDEERREWLRAHGWTVIVVDKDSFSALAIDEWIGDLRRALRLAA